MTHDEELRSNWWIHVRHISMFRNKSWIHVWPISMFINIDTCQVQHWMAEQWNVVFLSQKLIIFFSFFEFYFQNNYPYAWCNTWFKDLLEDQDNRPYRFPLALWLALGHGETRVFQKERNNPLCRFMMLSCTPRKRFDYEEVRRTDGRGHNRLIHGIQTGYKNEIKASQTDYNRAVRDTFREMQTYKRRSTISLNMAVLPAYMVRSERNVKVALSGLDGTVALASRAINQEDA